MRGLNGRSFTSGKRTNFSKEKDTPGPIYETQGFTDKFQNLRKKGQKRV